LGNTEGHTFPRAFERRENFLYLGKFFNEELERHVKKSPCKRTALSIGALLGKLEVVRLLGFLSEKENAYRSSFSWTQRTLKVKSGCHLEI
jgi:hypothetical protein